MPCTCSGPTLGKKEDSPTSAVKMIFRYELRSRCIESPRKFPEPQAGSSLGHWRSPRQNGSEGRRVRCLVSSPDRRVGWVVEMGGRGAGGAHPLEKSEPVFEDTSIPLLSF